MLDISFKTYIRMVGCFPEKVSSVSFQGNMAGPRTLREGVYNYFFLSLCAIISLSLSQVHVNVIVVDARTQAELIYAMRALMRFMKSK